MKRILILSVLALSLSVTSCERDVANVDKPPPDDVRVLNTNSFNLGVAINGAFERVPVSVQLIRYDYAPDGSLVTGDSVTYRISSTTNTSWRNIYKTTYPYRGVMTVTIRGDTAGSRVYARSVILTNQQGSIVNLDTTQQAVSGMASLRHISDVVPKVI